jgi:hypothetical protein
VGLLEALDVQADAGGATVHHPEVDEDPERRAPEVDSDLTRPEVVPPWWSAHGRI